jgi:CheY-like chemotaxis protein
VVWNLFSNAVKFTPESGSVTVQLERVNAHARIIVSDTGQGIDPQFLPFIFDRFRQADGSTTRKYGGLGLGLAIVRHLIELHGGTIEVQSDGIGRGATFTVGLPLRDAQREFETEAAATAPNNNGNQTLHYSPVLDGLRILIVDDEADSRDLITAVLVQSGAEVKGCETASEALAAIQLWRPDLLISDIGMPVEDGYSLIKKVRELGEEQYEQIPAVALTAYASMEDRDRAISAGFQTHLAKPVEPEDLLTTIASLTGRLKNTNTHAT